ncbi:AAA family ATPase, partial [uncultured Sutterella sp.]|uniref:AAA family ATPase n=1 Tax=uncultured Sutterella sp. TaxID=286133 RepID=UPI00280BE869
GALTNLLASRVENRWKFTMMKIIESAKNKPKQKFVLVIEEINRGHPAQIFGEMLTLLEADKRTPNCALELTYRLPDDERVFVPSNLYIIGTMNLADRSIAPLDLALRRRFAFLNLEPSLGAAWEKFLYETRGLSKPFIQNIRERIEELNKKISADTTKLGPQFRLGHSYVTPPEKLQNIHEKEWFRQTVNTQIGPLLEEYWYDAPYIAQKAKEELLAGL